jgi:hypothetical protein
MFNISLSWMSAGYRRLGIYRGKQRRTAAVLGDRPEPSYNGRGMAYRAFSAHAEHISTRGWIKRGCQVPSSTAQHVENEKCRFSLIFMLHAQNVAPLLRGCRIDSWDPHRVPKGPLIKVVVFVYVICKYSENGIKLSGGATSAQQSFFFFFFFFFFICTIFLLCNYLK